MKHFTGVKFLVGCGFVYPSIHPFTHSHKCLLHYDMDIHWGKPERGLPLWSPWLSAVEGNKSLTPGCSNLQRKPQGVTASLTCSGAVLSGMCSGCVGTWASSAKPLFKQTGTEIGMTRESKATKQRWPVRSGLKTGRLWLM